MITATTHKIDKFADFERLMKYADAVPSEFITVDVETNSVSEKTALLWGIGICFNDKRAFYLVWRDQKGKEIWTPEEVELISQWLLAVCQKKKLINHNIIYDVLVIENNLGIDLVPHIYADTILLNHTLDEEAPAALKELAVIMLGPWADKAQQAMKESVIANGGRWTEEQKDMYLCDTDIFAEYCMWDVLLTFMIFKILNKKLHEDGLAKLFYEDEVMPLYKEATIPMKRKGFDIDLPYFQQLKSEVEFELLKIEDEIMTDIKTDIKPFLSKVLDKEVPIKSGGNFPKRVADAMGIPLPVTKDGKVTLAAKGIQLQKEANPEDAAFYDWISDDLVHPFPYAGDDKVYDIRQAMLVKKNNDKAEKEGKKPVRYAFNLNSSDHLAFYFFTLKKYTPAGTSKKTGKPQVNAAFIDTCTGTDAQAQKIIDFKKLQKLLGTYINGIISRQIDGVIYASFLQFGTTSGRYSCTNPNLQNLPRIKDEEANLSELVLKYVNAIKKGFIPPKGFKIVNADYSSLEPVCFGHMSGSEGLRDIFRTGKDLYSQVAIDVNKLNAVYSADKKAPNFLKKHKPELRQLWKVPTLGIVYGMEEARLMQAIGCDRKTATGIIRGYLGTYPDLKQYMWECENSVKKNGYVTTVFGRVRHLPEAKILFDKYGMSLLDWRYAKARNLLDERRKFKQLLNNSKNFPIQGLAAHIVNRAMIQIMRRFKEEGIEAWIAAQVHDEITCIAREDQAERAKDIIRDCMQNTTTISIPLIAEPMIANNWAEAK